ncbi:RNA polymerase sigma factor [Virgibacillus pantothenticus]|uniref:RNA polymerase sigma factor n=1 Tax=Virgibacillus pantothenticus TaxID=1473 RepID=UPI00147D4171|nr:sigma factor-like helix-turn-helix DNA-binding protein [Virgibacillus pantothenticus]
MLDRFANLILHEDLTWSHPDKMSIVEYPVMSDAQECRRERKYRPSDNVYYDSGQFSGRKTGYDMGEDGELGKKTSSPVFSPIHNEEINRKDVSIDVLTLLDDAGLTTRQREAVELVYFEGLTQEQAAERMGIHKANVNAYVGFALDKLRVVT